jgi:tripeptidyl-peptidase-1
MSAQYQIPNGTRAAKGNELGIFESLSQHYSQEDLDTYWKYVAP